VFWKDRNLVYLGCNTAFARDAGFAGPKDMIGKNDNQMVWREQAEAYRRDDWQVIESGQPKLLIEESQTTPAGKTITLLSSKLPLRDFKGKIIGMLGTYLDITARKEAEASRDRLATAVEQASETIVITDTKGTILYANPAFEKTSGYTRAEALGQNPRVLKSGKQDAEFYRQMWAVLQRGEVWNGHFINRRKDGTLYEEEANISPVRDAAGKIINYVAVKRDVTHEVQLETQFRQAQKMEAVGQLAGGVAHDFNNILAVIQMQSSLLKSDGLSTEQTELADGITESVQRAVALTRQLLLFSRREVFQPRDLELNETIAATTKMLKRMLGETIEMQLKLAAQPLFLHADAGMLDQVLMNLCVNARDAMPGGGHLLIETAGVELDELAVGQSVQARAGSFVRLSVSDNGGGIPPEILPKIFEPFFTTKPVGKGTGLGLATVFGIVQQHQGWINAYSEVGHGTAFRIYLPRLAGNVLLKSASPVLAAMRGGHETILLAEDDPALRVAVRKALAQLGYRILEAPTGVKALAVWQENRNEISLLLTDLVMPDGMTGKALAQRLLQENSKLKVIYMSGYSAEVVGKDFPFTEDVNFLTKPFPAQKLAQTIRNCLDAST
jgi:PAS domain S-box-containing protein